MARKKVAEERAKPEVVELAITDLKLNENNPRRSKRPDSLTASLKRFGFVNPIIGWRRPDGEVQIVAGHQRLEAAKASKLAKVPVIIYPFKDEKEARAFGVADNRLAEVVADWDFDKLRDELKSFDHYARKTDDFDIKSLGWDTNEWTKDIWREPGTQTNAEDIAEEVYDWHGVKLTGLMPPFRWIGGKRKIAPLVWERFGKVDGYIEPFAGGLAVLLGNPHPAKVEIVNDLDGCIANFWRAAKHHPEKVAEVAGRYGRMEVDLVAGWNSLLAKRPSLNDAMKDDLEFCDPELAGLWLWCVQVWSVGDFSGKKIGAKLPNETSHIGGDYIAAISSRMSNCCVYAGPWERAVARASAGTSLVGVFLDPPYSMRNISVGYAIRDVDGDSVSAAVLAWALENASDRVRIALCENVNAYKGKIPDSWSCVRWKSQGLSGNKSGGCGEEAVWFSPTCLSPAK
jgi:site-specific DNA-adenine methylase